MTAEKMYESVCKMLYDYDGATGQSGAGAVIASPHEYEKCFIPFYAEAAKMLVDLREQMDKKTTPAARVSAIKRVVKSAMANGNRDLWGIFECGDKYCVCDGYRLCVMDTDIESVPHVANRLDVLKMIPAAEDGEEIPAPTTAEVKAYNAKCRAAEGTNHTYVYRLCDDVCVNPRYLLDALQMCGDGAKVYVYGARKAVLFVGDGIKTIVLPVSNAYCKTL